MKKGNTAVFAIVLLLLSSCGANTGEVNNDNYQEAAQVTEEVEVDEAAPQVEETSTGEGYENLPAEELEMAIKNATTTTEDFTTDDVTVVISTDTFVFLDEEVATDTLLINDAEIGGFEAETGLNIEYVKTEGSNVEFTVESSKGTDNYVYDVSTGTNTATLVSE